MEARGDVENGNDDCGNEILAREPGVVKAAAVDDDDDDDEPTEDDEVKDDDETW